MLVLQQITLIVYHQPLVSILDRCTFDAAENPRLQRMKKRVSKFMFKTVQRKGLNHAIPNALSRARVIDSLVEETTEAEEITRHIHKIIKRESW